MTKILEPESEHEILSAKNGITMNTLAKMRMNKALFVIILLVNDESAEKVKAWHKSKPKYYQLRVLDKYNSLIQKEIPRAHPKIEWTDLDEKNSNSIATIVLGRDIYTIAIMCPC